MAVKPQLSFAGGELTPELHTRVDTYRYASGAKDITNCTVKRTGGVESRPGSQFLGEVKDSTKSTRLVPFVFSDGDAYDIELGHLYLRFWKDDAIVASDATADTFTTFEATVTSLTKASPAALLVPSTSAIFYLSSGVATVLNNADRIVFFDCQPELANRVFVVTITRKNADKLLTR